MKDLNAYLHTVLISLEHTLKWAITDTTKCTLSSLGIRPIVISSKHLLFGTSTRPNLNFWQCNSDFKEFSAIIPFSVVTKDLITKRELYWLQGYTILVSSSIQNVNIFVMEFWLSIHLRFGFCMEGSFEYLKCLVLLSSWEVLLSLTVFSDFHVFCQ